MPKLPQPVKQQLSQLLRGTLETVAEQPKEMAKTALEQVGVVSKSERKSPPPSVLKPGETLSPEQIENKRHHDLMQALQLVQKLDQETLQISQQKVQQKEQEEKQADLAHEQQKQAAIQNAPIDTGSTKPQRGSALMGGGQRKKHGSTLTSAFEKSHAETVGKRVSG